jgi:hypothetical protein
VSLAKPWLDAAIATPSEAPIFPDANGNFLFVRISEERLVTLLNGLPRCKEATLHGLRLGCDTELKLAKVSDEIRDFMGWWARVLRRMGEHYEALELERIVEADLVYGLMMADQPLPGVVTAVGEYVPPAEAAAAAAAVQEDAAAASSSVRSTAKIMWAPPDDAVDPRLPEADDAAVGSSAQATSATKRRRVVRCSRCREAGADEDVYTGHTRRTPTCPTSVQALLDINPSAPGEDDSESEEDQEVQVLPNIVNNPLRPGTSLIASLFAGGALT